MFRVLSSQGGSICNVHPTRLLTGPAPSSPTILLIASTRFLFQFPPTPLATPSSGRPPLISLVPNTTIIIRILSVGASARQHFNHRISHPRNTSRRTSQRW
ncbi:hypothetical protein CCM_03707 [Cordyceps militaris CM01]|uniref:Uncharacterized protein n=1 Tax=Cordyceps militaris (strain CM01) TaxID=983644 RepID=G3JG57_CORMM|nr:uncharacterized protein CCM_03707 [Cordyceps militaris CM01]EGX92335.1 hypothetical protein CCM_03707 [Cordyceps militaris CM01]